MNPTLYDILGVSRDASREEIRTAWREAADRFEPGEGGSTQQFRLFNEAAEILLDPERRRAYDAQLDQKGGEAEKSPTTEKAHASPAAAAPIPGPAMPGAARATTPSPTPQTDSVVQPVESRHWWRRRRGQRDVDETASAAAADRGGSSGRRVPPRWGLAVLGVLTALAVGGASYFVAQAERAEGYREALDRAPAAAESAAAAILSYDHESLEADRDAAAKFLTDGYRGDYVDTFDKLVAESATETQATVEAEVLASSAMLGGSERDPDRVPVLLFVNQTTTSGAKSGEPSVALNRVRLDMVRVDGTWLVDGITSY